MKIKVGTIITGILGTSYRFSCLKWSLVVIQRPFQWFFLPQCSHRGPQKAPKILKIQKKLTKMNENQSLYNYYWNFRDPLVGSLALRGIKTHSEKNSMTSPNLKFFPLFSLSNPPKKVTFHIKGVLKRICFFKRTQILIQFLQQRMHFFSTV